MPRREPLASRPLWLITLADLSLLLVGFFVFLQAVAHQTKSQQAAIQAGIRDAFGGDPAQRLAVDSNMIGGFAPGRAELPRDTAAVIGWARDALADPRTVLIVTGYADGSEPDRLEQSGLALAGLRAERVTQALAQQVPADRIRTGAAVAPGLRGASLAISYDR